MNSKSSISFDINIIDENQKVDFDGITFSNIYYIIIFINGLNILEDPLFEGSFIYFNELKKSTIQSGKYLIFTSVTGIADDAGWDYVEVNHYDNTIMWTFVRDDIFLSYTFDKYEYMNQVLRLEDKINNTDKNLRFEPSHVIYPESM